MSLIDDIGRYIGGDGGEARRRHHEDLLKSLYVMASMVEARDPYTGGHLWRVSQFSRLLADDSGLPGTDVARIALGGFLHDLGKIGVPDAILNKPDRLTDAEYAVIKTHPEIGGRLLAGHPLAELVRAAVLSHHETPDGTGYPRRLAVAAVPLWPDHRRAPGASFRRSRLLPPLRRRGARRAGARRDPAGVHGPHGRCRGP